MPWWPATPWKKGGTRRLEAWCVSRSHAARAKAPNIVAALFSVLRVKRLSLEGLLSLCGARRGQPPPIRGRLPDEVRPDQGHCRRGPPDRGKGCSGQQEQRGLEARFGYPTREETDGKRWLTGMPEVPRASASDQGRHLPPPVLRRCEGSAQAPPPRPFRQALITAGQLFIRPVPTLCGLTIRSNP